MIERVTVLASDLAASEGFYSTVLAALGRAPETARLVLEPAADAHAVTCGLHVAFVAPTRAHVEAFWQAGVDAGHRDDGPPGPRPRYLPDYYGAFLLDPDGNSVEAVHGGDLPEGSPASIDHLWIRVADVRAARERWLGLAPRAGLRLGTERPDRVHFESDHGGVSLVAGTPTRGAHVAFRAQDPADPGELVADPHGGSLELLPGARA